MILNHNTFGEHDQQPVFLLHGLFGMADNLTSLAKCLSAQYFVVVPDLINHGHSAHRKAMDYCSMAQDVIVLADHLAIAQFSILGHSMGGKVAMQVADLIPSRIKKLIVADIAPVAYPPKHVDIFDQMAVVASKDLHQRRDVEAILAEKVSEKSLRQFFMKNMFRDEQGCWRWRFGLSEIAEGYLGICAAPKLQHQKKDGVLFIRGELSDYVTRNMRDQILQFYPHVALKEIQGAGHWLHAEKPQIFNKLVERFLLQDTNISI